MLNATNANYSFASLHRVFRQAFKKINLSKKEINSVLVLGCGAGSIPQIIFKELALNPKIDAVEIDEKVIELANKYFGLNKYDNLNVIIDDAINHVETTNKKYDLICIDIFNGINVPDAILTQQFLSQVRNCLNENGEVLFNFVAHNHETKEKTKEIEKLLLSLFSNHETFKIEGINRLFHSVK